MVLDSDSKAEDILIKLIKPPTGGELILCSEIQSVINDNNSPDKILEKDDTFSAQDLISAKVHLKHTDPTVDNMQMQIKLWNKESENEAMDYTINAYVCYPTKDQNIETSLWINMFKNADKTDENAGINSLTDFSGNNNNSVEVFGFPVLKEKISPSGNDALFMDGRSFFRFGNDPISDKTTNIFSVFKSTGSKNQSLWAGT
ncbi:Hemolysin-type calcium-binding region, partial [Candidatus Magnetomorum sp. HK-1]